MFRLLLINVSSYSRNMMDTIWCLKDENENESHDEKSIMLDTEDLSDLTNSSHDPLQERTYGFQDTDPNFHRTLSLKEKCISASIIKSIMDRNVDAEDVKESSFIFITDKIGRGIEIPINPDHVTNSKSALLDKIVRGYHQAELCVTDIYIMKDIMMRVCRADEESVSTLEAEYGLEYFKCLILLEIPFDITKLVKQSLSFMEYITMIELLELPYFAHQCDNHIVPFLLQPRNLVLKTIVSNIHVKKINQRYLPDIKRFVSRNVILLKNKDTVSIWDMNEKRIFATHKSKSTEYDSFYSLENLKLPSGFFTQNVVVAKIYSGKISVVTLDLITGNLLSEQTFQTTTRAENLNAVIKKDTIISVSKPFKNRVIGLNKCFLVTQEQNHTDFVFRIFHRKRCISYEYVTSIIETHEATVHFVAYTLDVLLLHFHPSKMVLIYFPPEIDTSKICIMDFTLAHYDAKVLNIACSQGGRYVAVSVVYTGQRKRGERVSNTTKTQIWRTLIFDIILKKRVCLNFEATVPIGVTHCWDPKTARTDQHAFSTTFSYSTVYPANKVCVVHRVFPINSLLIYAEDMCKPMTVTSMCFVTSKMGEKQKNMLSFVSKSKYLIPIFSSFTHSSFKKPDSISVMFKNNIILCFRYDSEGKMYYEVTARFKPGLEDTAENLTSFDSFTSSAIMTVSPF